MSHQQRRGTRVDFLSSARDFIFGSGRKIQDLFRINEVLCTIQKPSL